MEITFVLFACCAQAQAQGQAAAPDCGNVMASCRARCQQTQPNNVQCSATCASDFTQCVKKRAEEIKNPEAQRPTVSQLLSGGWRVVAGGMSGTAEAMLVLQKDRNVALCFVGWPSGNDSVLSHPTVPTKGCVQVQ